MLTLLQTVNHQDFAQPNTTLEDLLPILIAVFVAILYETGWIWPGLLLASIKWIQKTDMFCQYYWFCQKFQRNKKILKDYCWIVDGWWVSMGTMYYNFGSPFLLATKWWKNIEELGFGERSCLPFFLFICCWCNGTFYINILFNILFIS